MDNPMAPVNLTYFIKLAETGNITKAADELFISRQALSKYIQNLETALGASLFVRSKKGVALTSAGELLMDYVERTTLLWTETMQKIKLQSDRYTIQMGIDIFHVPSTVIRYILRYADLNPQATIKIINLDERKEILKALNKGSVDISLTINLPETDGIKKIVLRKVKIFLLMGKDHELASKKKLDFFEDLKGQRILLMADNDFSQDIVPFSKKARINTKAVVPNFAVIEDIILREKTLYPVPDFLAKSLVSEHITCRECSSFPHETDLCLFYREDREELLSPFIRYLVDNVPVMFADHEPSDSRV